MKFTPLSLILFLVTAVSGSDIVTADKAHDDPRANIFDNENMRHASLALRRLMQPSAAGMKKTTDFAAPIVEDIGSGPDGGRLLLLNNHNSLTIEAKGGDEGRLLKSKKKSKGPKAPKLTKLTKSSKMSKASKTSKCTKLVAENENWETWLPDITTFTPIFRPATDNELRRIIESSKKYGCTIRMMGARHSWDGMVMQRKEEDVVVISLASHTTEIEGWLDSIHPESSTFRIGAGKSWYDVSALIRPHGYVLNSRASGAYFSVGGVIANMVHGGGRATGFMHDDVVKMLVLISDGSFREIEGGELKYWRSSAGQLGMIIAIEMKMHSEAIPFVTGYNEGQPTFDLEKGGLNMERERTVFPSPTNAVDFVQFISDLTSKIYQTHATYDSAQFFFDYYSNSLNEYRTNFSGPRFSGAVGSFPDAAKAAQYDAATKANVDIYPDVAFSGGDESSINEEILCATICVPPTGPDGDGSPCIQVPSTIQPGKLLCEVPLEISAVLSSQGQTQLDAMWDSALAYNDGFFIVLGRIPTYDVMITFLPARALASGIGTWIDITTKAVTGMLPGIDYFPNSSLEFRFVNPIETAVLNPIPTIEETKSAFNEKNAQFYGDNAFDVLMPPLPPGISDGYVAIEFVHIRNVYDQDASKFIVVLQEALRSMPTNPLLPYSEFIVKDCDAMSGIFPCQGFPQGEAKCCNPPIPSYNTHLGKGWGFGFDPSTTPITGKFPPFKDPIAIENMFATGSKRNSISNFNTKRKELKADLFSGGAMLRWLEPSFPNSDFEVRKLDKQVCGSPDFMLDPNKECINNSCVGSICV